MKRRRQRNQRNTVTATAAPMQTAERLAAARMASAYRALKARYDAAQTTEDNRKHWAAADSMSATAANSQTVRRTLRNRSRYEVANNCYARGMLNTIAAYTIGQGPTLQLTWRGQSLEPSAERQYRDAAQKVEQLWATWAYARKLNKKLVTSVIALDQDGEVFAMMSNDRRRRRGLSPVQLDLRLYEADWFDDPTPKWQGDDSGVRIDRSGEARAYSMLEQHPGDNDAIAQLKANWISAERVLHLFRCERPGQLRGIPRTTPALPLFALLRRFTLATCVATETAADFAAILYGDNPSEFEQSQLVEAWDRVEIERGAMLTAPGGSRIAQLKAEHPNATFDEFTRAILREIARCLSIPAVIALGDASNYNYASGRLDLQSFFRQMSVDRSHILEAELLDPLYTAWVDEAELIEGFLPPEFRQQRDAWEWAWRWTEPEHVDRAKEADGQEVELRNNTTTLAREYARRGLDWETELRQRAREIALTRELGIAPVEPGSDDAADDDENADDAGDNQQTSQRGRDARQA